MRASMAVLTMLALTPAGPGQQLMPLREGHDLVNESLPARVDEGLSLGNGTLGCTVFGGEEIVLGLEHTRLWDTRAPQSFDSPDFRFDTIAQAWQDGRPESLRNIFEDPATLDPAPTRLPAGELRLLFDTGFLPRSSRLSLAQAEIGVELEGLGEIEIFVHALEPVGRVRVTGLRPMDVQIVPPTLGAPEGEELLTTTFADARRLGYPEPETGEDVHWCWYRQEGFGGSRHAVMARWQDRGSAGWELAWTIVVSTDEDPLQVAQQRLLETLDKDFDEDRREHREWWRSFWNQSGLRLPEREIALEAQWYRAQFLFGCSARANAPPVSRRGILSEPTLDRLPSDKGALVVWNLPDTYRFSLSSNRPEGVRALVDEYTALGAALRDWTQRFYGRPGLNVPAIHTIHGRPMGGPAELAFSSTASCQLACLFAEAVEYYPEDEELGQRSFAFLQDVAKFLWLHLSRKGEATLDLSTSPELGEASEGAWPRTLSNYDHALIRSTLRAAIRLAAKYGDEARKNEVKDWQGVLDRLPEDWQRSIHGQGLSVAPGVPLAHSHRHFSHLLAIYPLGLVDGDRSPTERALIEASLDELDAHGSENWIGSSFAWRAALAARASRGEEAEIYLRVFTDAFCALNGVHVGGDQSDRHYTRFRDRVPSLDGNSRFAAALQEMLLQSHRDGLIVLFPAVPRSWQELEFTSLRARGGFLISARRSEGRLVEVSVTSEAGRRLRMKNPFEEWPSLVAGGTFVERGYEETADGVLEFDTIAGERYVLRPGH